MKVNLSLEFSSPEGAIAALIKLQNLGLPASVQLAEVPTTGAERAPEVETPAPKKAGRPPKAKAPEAEKPAAKELEVPTPAEVEAEADPLGLGDLEAPAEAAKEYEIEDVISAAKAYAAKHSSDKAVKLLEKFGVRSIRSLKKEQYGDAIKMYTL